MPLGSLTREFSKRTKSKKYLERGIKNSLNIQAMTAAMATGTKGDILFTFIHLWTLIDNKQTINCTRTTSHLTDVTDLSLSLCRFLQQMLETLALINHTSSQHKQSKAIAHKPETHCSSTHSSSPGMSHQKAKVGQW